MFIIHSLIYFCRNIPAGSVIIVESPVASVNVEEYCHRYCNHCYAQLNLQVRLIPCPMCAEVAYCSEICRDKARGKMQCFWSDIDIAS